MLLKDSSGKKSVTMTTFVLGFIVVCVKLLFSGMTIKGFTLSPFTGGEFAASVAALGSVYTLRRNFGKTNSESEDK